MKYVLIVLGILIILDITYFAFINQGQALEINYKPLIDTFTVGSGLLYFFLGIYGLLGGFLLCHARVIGLRNEVKNLLRKTEKASLATEESSDRVQALEAKVKTLEAALKDCLDKK